MIILSPFSRKLPSGKPNPKNYPFWPQLIQLLPDPIIQVGSQEETQLTQDFRTGLKLSELAQLVEECTVWIGCDSFFQHFCWDLGKPGIVLWGPSDPLIYGHSENINLLKSREYLVENQFLTWEQQPYREDIWCSPHEVLTHVTKFFPNWKPTPTLQGP